MLHIAIWFLAEIPRVTDSEQRGGPKTGVESNYTPICRSKISTPPWSMSFTLGLSAKNGNHTNSLGEVKKGHAYFRVAYAANASRHMITLLAAHLRCILAKWVRIPPNFVFQLIDLLSTYLPIVQRQLGKKFGGRYCVVVEIKTSAESTILLPAVGIPLKRKVPRKD